jgi:hypothetical protein
MSSAVFFEQSLLHDPRFLRLKKECGVYALSYFPLCLTLWSAKNLGLSRKHIIITLANLGLEDINKIDRFLEVCLEEDLLFCENELYFSPEICKQRDGLIARTKKMNEFKGVSSRDVNVTSSSRDRDVNVTLSSQDKIRHDKIRLDKIGLDKIRRDGADRDFESAKPAETSAGGGKIETCGVKDENFMLAETMLEQPDGTKTFENTAAFTNCARRPMCKYPLLFFNISELSEVLKKLREHVPKPNWPDIFKKCETRANQKIIEGRRPDELPVASWALGWAYNEVLETCREEKYLEKTKGNHVQN